MFDYGGHPVCPRGVPPSFRVVYEALCLCVKLCPGTPGGLWRLFRFWLSDSRVDIPGKADMKAFWNLRDRSVPIPDIWDSFKVCMRGSFQAHIGSVHKGARMELQEAEALESAFVRDRSPHIVIT